MLRFMDAPDYAVLNTQVELIKRLGKKELSGFVNAVLRRSADVILPISAKDAVFEISVNYSCPEWIVDRLISQYGEAFTRDFLSSRLPEKTHVRVNEDKNKQRKFYCADWRGRQSVRSLFGLCRIEKTACELLCRSVSVKRAGGRILFRGA